MSFRSLRPLSSTTRLISQTRRAITITSARLSESKGADADSHSKVRVTGGKPFADGAKVKEGSVSGITGAREPVEGKSPYSAQAEKWNADPQHHLLESPFPSCSASRTVHT
jgi:hypothetical protein